MVRFAKVQIFGHLEIGGDSSARGTEGTESKSEGEALYTLRNLAHGGGKWKLMVLEEEKVRYTEARF